MGEYQLAPSSLDRRFKAHPIYVRAVSNHFEANHSEFFIITLDKDFEWKWTVTMCRSNHLCTEDSSGPRYTYLKSSRTAALPSEVGPAWRYYSDDGHWIYDANIQCAKVRVTKQLRTV